MPTRLTSSETTQPVLSSRDVEVGAKQSFRDALFELLDSASKQPGMPAECHAAIALRALFIQAPLALVTALVDRETGRHIRQVGALAEAIDGPAHPLTEDELARWLPELPSDLSSVDDKMRTGLFEDADRWLLVLGRRPAGCLLDLEERIYVIMNREPMMPESAIRREWFATYLQGLNEFFVTMRALQTADRHGDLEQAIAELTRERTDEPLEQVFVAATRILEELLYEIGCDDPQQQYLKLAVRLTRWIVHQALGTGWLTAPDTVRGNRAVRGFANVLARAAAVADRDEVPREARVLACRLRLFALTLDPSPDRPPDMPRPKVRRPRAWRSEMEAMHPDGEAPTRIEDWLLAAWTGVHAAVSRYERTPGITGQEQEEIWAWAVDRCSGLIGQLLADAGETLETSRLALWFALQLLPGTVGRRAIGSRGRRWAVRSRLSWVIRESLRRVVDGRLSDYVWDQDRWVEAMFDLIETHAHLVLKVPVSFDVRGSLSAFGRTVQMGDRRLLEGHRRHTIAVYLAGNFLLDLQRVGPSGAKAAVDTLLVSPDEPETATDAQVRDLRAAYALASLHHDVGLLILERISDLSPWSDLLDLPRDALETFQRRRAEDRAEFLTRCHDELEASGLLAHLGGGPWTPDGDTGDHALVSAWMLAQLGRNSSVSDEVLGAAVRAVLLHGEVTYVVDIAKDPAGALLVLADQLFEWEPPTHALPASRGTRGGYRSRTRSIRVEGLSIAYDHEGPRAEVVQDQFWPAFSLELHHPEVVGTPTWHTWLSLAQILGRIRTRTHGWNPAVRLTCPIDARLADLGLDTYELLDRCATTPSPELRPLALALREWLAAIEQFEVDEERRFEVLRLHSLRLERDVRLAFADLHAALDRLTD
jgi:hypothetical protein